jgi:excisionase family DNA binding protein
MDKLLTLGEVAQVLRVSLTTAKIWASKRRFPVVKVGRLVRVAPEALEEWIRENTTQPSPQVNKHRSRAPKGPKAGRFNDVLEELKREGSQQGE